MMNHRCYLCDAACNLKVRFGNFIRARLITHCCVMLITLKVRFGNFVWAGRPFEGFYVVSFADYGHEKFSKLSICHCEIKLLHRI